MTRIKPLFVALALLPIACSDDSSGSSASAGASAGTTETGTATDSDSESESESNETGTASASTTAGDGDGDPAGDGDGDTAGDGDGDTAGDGDGDTAGDGDGDTAGDGDGDTGGDGDGDTSGDGDGDTGGDGDGDTGGDGDGEGTGGDGDGDGEDTDACNEFEVTLEPLPPNVMLVLDKSRSMFVNSWDHDNNGGTPVITRWNSLYNVVDNIATTFDQQINFGANLFPSVQAQNVYGPAACITSDLPEVNANPGNAAAILATIPGANVLNSYGGTPATIGIQTAYDHLMSLPPDNPRAMILITDGAANCDQNAQNLNELFEVYDDALPVLVGDAADDGILTYVVGIDIANMVINDGVGGDPNNINPSTKLNEVAQQGGTVSFFNSQDEAELEAALTEVVESVKTCIIPLDEPPFFPDFTKVIVGNVEYALVDDCDNEDGWVYTNPNGPYDAIELCGSACDEVKITGEADVQYFCNPG